MKKKGEDKMQKTIEQKIKETIIKNDLNLIDRERMGNIRTISLKALGKDLVKLFKEKK